MYLIVLFQKESKTDPVAKEWLSDGISWWPPYSDKIQILRSVKKKGLETIYCTCALRIRYFFYVEICN